MQMENSKDVRVRTSNVNGDEHPAKKKCTCVPSGACHSHTLLGCPHQHYYDERGVWTCVMK